MESRLIDYEGKIATLTYENLNLTIQEQSQKRQS